MDQKSKIKTVQVWDTLRIYWQATKKYPIYLSIIVITNLIVIAHRLSTIMAMDRIVVIEKGKIKEQGSHDELLKVRQGSY